MDLRKSWKITQNHLEAAYSLLPLLIKEELSVGSVERFHEWLAHNELELALDELEGLGQLNNCSSAFWRELLAAAQNMNLQGHVVRYKSKLE
jgi:hypothetical protein